MDAKRTRENPTRRDFCAQAARLALLAGAPILSAAQATGAPEEPPLPTYRCRKVAPFKIDGDLDKAVWRAAREVRLVSATGKQRGLQPTTLRACRSETHLYVGFHCTDSDIRSTYTRRDDPLYEEDVVEVFLCPDQNLTRYIELEFSPRNVIFDARVQNPAPSGSGIQVDTWWDCEGLRCAATIKGDLDDHTRPDTWWTMEAAIPFEGLGVPKPSAGERWRANFYRIDYGKRTEFSAFSPTLKDPANYHVPTRFGWLAFV